MSAAAGGVHIAISAGLQQHGRKAERLEPTCFTVRPDRECFGPYQPPAPNDTGPLVMGLLLMAVVVFGILANLAESASNPREPSRTP